MAYLKESDVRRVARADARVLAKSMDSGAVLRESSELDPSNKQFDVFLCHAIRDAEIILGAKRILEQQKLQVYVDWIVDPEMDRSAVTAKTADTLRNRMQNSSSLLYLFSNNSKRSRWMPWELGYFDALKGNVAVLPIVSDAGGLDFSQEEYLDLYPKIELQDSGLWVNRTKQGPVSAEDKKNYRLFKEWIAGSEKLRHYS